jgi:hypothetical protein
VDEDGYAELRWWAALGATPADVAENPHHRVWRETTYDGIRYIAQSLDLGIHPHTLVTRSLPELRAALNASQP